MKLKGVYIVSESACLKPGSGAFNHIRHGMYELGRHFEMIQLNFCNTVPDTHIQAESPSPPSKRFSKLRYLIKGTYLLTANHRQFIRRLNEVRKQKPDFIYERAAYLNFTGLLIAKVLKIPHFYEVNGILWKDNESYHPAYWNSIAKRLEGYFYKRSSFVFFIGGLAKYFSVPADRFLSVQNGIESSFVQSFAGVKRKFDSVLNIVFVGHAMDHHRLDVILKASFLLRRPMDFHLHLIGSNMESLDGSFNPALTVTFHGVQTHQALESLLKDYHIGIIPYTRDYFSNVKAFMYCGAGLCVILPRVGNFANVFPENAVVSVENESPVDLAAKLDFLADNRTAIEHTSEIGFDLVSTRYTWDRIFSAEAEVINRAVK